MRIQRDLPRNGGEGARTPDLFHAMEALSQLSYTPVRRYRPCNGIWLNRARY